MDKEKQDRFDCKHLECNMDGCYCSAGHGSIRGYGHCVIPYEQKTCKYFERKPKLKTVKITENEIVISKEEYNDLKGLEKRFDDYLMKEIIGTRKETAREILTNLKPLLEGFVNADTGENLYVNKCKQYGVEIGE